MNEKELFVKAQNGDKEAREKLILDNIGLVYKAAQNHGKYYIDFDTAVQEGSIGLIKAVDNFDPNKGFKFSTYAWGKIFGAIQNFKRERNETIPYRMNTTDYYAYGEIKKARNIYNTNEEIAKYLDKDVNYIEFVIKMAEENTSIYSKVKDFDEVRIIDVICDKTKENDVINNIYIKEALKHLNEKQSKVIKLKYIVGLGVTQIAELLKCSRNNVYYEERKALKILKEAM